MWGGQTFGEHRRPPPRSRAPQPFPSRPPVLSHWLGFGWRGRTGSGEDMETPLRWWTWTGQAGTGRGPGGGVGVGGRHPAVRLSGFHPVAQPRALWTRRGWLLLASSGLTVAILARRVRVGPEAPGTSAHLCCCRLPCLSYWLSLCHEPWTSRAPCSPRQESQVQARGEGQEEGFGQGDLSKASQSTSVLFATARPCPLPAVLGRNVPRWKKRPDVGGASPPLIS